MSQTHTLLDSDLKQDSRFSLGSAIACLMRCIFALVVWILAIGLITGAVGAIIVCYQNNVTQSSLWFRVLIGLIVGIVSAAVIAIITFGLLDRIIGKIGGKWSSRLSDAMWWNHSTPSNIVAGCIWFCWVWPAFIIVSAFVTAGPCIVNDEFRQPALWGLVIINPFEDHFVTVEPISVSGIAVSGKLVEADGFEVAYNHHYSAKFEIDMTNSDAKQFMRHNPYATDLNMSRKCEEGLKAQIPSAIKAVNTSINSPFPEKIECVLEVDGLVFTGWITKNTSIPIVTSRGTIIP